MIKKGNIMNEKIKAIKDYFMENGCVFLAKQCNKEYILYFFSANSERNAIVRQNKQHFKNRDLEGGKSKRKKVYIPLDKFFNDVIFDLINRGYELELFEE